MSSYSLGVMLKHWIGEPKKMTKLPFDVELACGEIDARITSLEKRLEIACAALVKRSVHDVDCALSVNVRHGCTCGARFAEEALDQIKEQG